MDMCGWHNDRPQRSWIKAMIGLSVLCRTRLLLLWQSSQLVRATHRLTLIRPNAGCISARLSTSDPHAPPRCISPQQVSGTTQSHRRTPALCLKETVSFITHYQ